MCLIPNKMLKQYAISNSKLRNLKFIHQIDAEKLVKDELCMQLTQRFENFKFSEEDITSDYGFLLRLANTFTVDTVQYNPRCYKVNDAKKFKNLVVSFYTLC